MITLKKLLLITAFLLPLMSSAQHLKSYKAINGRTYHPGDTVKLGRGSSPMSHFMYVQQGGWAKWFFMEPNKGYSEFDIDKRFAGYVARIKEIKTRSYHGMKKTVFITGMGGISNVDIYIDDAINNGEIAYTGTIKPIQPAGVQAQLSPADELIKYKQLLDMGAISVNEFDAKKKQLMSM